MAIEYPIKKSLGSDVNNFPKVQQEKIKEIIDAINALTDGSINTDTLTISTLLSVLGATVVETLTVNDTTSLKGLLILGDATPQTRTGAGAITLTEKTTFLVTTGTNALTLADGTPGQIKFIIMKTDGGDGTLTPTNLLGGTTITFSAVGQSATLMFLDGKWNVIGLVGAVLA